MANPLDGITVLDVAWTVAGPYATMPLADVGARVIKTKRPEAGDFTGSVGPPLWAGRARTS
jgi:crotonobetainyl-CoA:carnitine CoA-transferase CaiB-like acyl-CoA transferase